MKPTIYDVAKVAEVSIATVSKVINKTGRISEETIKKVEKVMEELDYQPSVVASALTGKQTYTIGMIIPDLANPHFAEVARGVEDRASQLGYNMIICSTDNDLEKEEKYILLLNQKSVDGIIVATGARHTSSLKQLIQRKIPVVLLSRDLPSLKVDAVLLDDFLGGYQATSHLLSLGHEKIAMITEDLHYSSTSERVRGYKQAMEDAGLTCEDRFIWIADFTMEGAKWTAERLLASDDPPTAIFTSNDLLAMGALQAAREAHLSIPDDLSIVGFDDTILAKLVDPSLTTVRQPNKEMGQAVMDLLVEEIRQEKRGKRKVVLMPELVIRNSTTKPRARSMISSCSGERNSHGGR